MAENHPSTKHCTRCQSDKPASEFYTNGTNKNGSPRLKAECKSCERVRMAKWREANPLHSTDWNRRNPGRSNAQARARYAAIPVDQRRRTKKKNRERHRDRELAYAKAYRKAHLEWARDYSKQYYPRYYATPHGKAVIAQIAHSRNAAKRGSATEDLTEYISQIKSSPEVECHICGVRLPGASCHIDHIIPLARGGTHTKGNIAPAHPICNMRKGAKLNFKIEGQRCG
jgi:5-methylcytosine-specific restriction endonuclease McrA